jgi:hypothetical protein
MFPRALRRAHSDPDDHEALTILRMLHRICRVYAAIGIAVPSSGSPRPAASDSSAANG